MVPSPIYRSPSPTSPASPAYLTQQQGTTTSCLTLRAGASEGHLLVISSHDKKELGRTEQKDNSKGETEAPQLAQSKGREHCPPESRVYNSSLPFSSAQPEGVNGCRCSPAPQLLSGTAWTGRHLTYSHATSPAGSKPLGAPQQRRGQLSTGCLTPILFCYLGCHCGTGTMGVGVIRSDDEGARVRHLLAPDPWQINLIHTLTLGRSRLPAATTTPNPSMRS